MGGFTINGCGAADSYYPIKNLHNAHCTSCGRERMFALMELKRKVKVFYIPTFSVGSKYAVVCSHCKDGWYVSDMQKEFILSNPADSVRIDAEGVHLEGLEELPPVVQEAVPAAPAVQESAPVVQETATEAVPAPAKVCTCGAVLAENARFCGQCGKRWEEPTPKSEPVPDAAAVQEIPPENIPAPVPAVEMPKAPSVDALAAIRKKKVCPECRMMFPLERQICPICGTALEEKK